MRSKRGAAILAAVSAVLLAVSLGYFSLTPGAWSSLDIGTWSATLLQTTAAEPDTGSADPSEDKDAAKTTADEDKGEDAGNNEAVKSEEEGAGASANSIEGEGPSGAAATHGTGTSSDVNGNSSTSASDGGTSSSQPSVSAPANTVTVSVSVASSAVGNPVSASGTYTFDKGATAYDALCALGLSVNASSTSMGVYVSAIGGLAEKEHGATSGWMYSVNGAAPNYSASGYKLQDGDSVSWYYVTD